jgi:hypothetical protein
VVVLGMPPGISRAIKESQGGATIFVRPLAIKDPERSRLLLDSTSALELSPKASPEPIDTGIDSACKDGIGAL